MKPSLVPLDETDFVGEMATVLRTNGMTFDGGETDVEDRAFNILWRNPCARGGFSYGEIAPRLHTAIERARELGPINLDAEVEPA